MNNEKFKLCVFFSVAFLVAGFATAVNMARFPRINAREIPELVLMIKLDDGTKFVELSHGESLEIFEAIGVGINNSTDANLYSRGDDHGPFVRAHTQSPETVAALFISPALKDDSPQLQNLMVWVNEIGEPLNPWWNDCYRPSQKRIFRALIEKKLAAHGVSFQ